MARRGSATSTTSRRPPDDLVALAAEAARELAERRRQHPLAYYTLWDAPPPKTSQLRAAQDILQGRATINLVLGGNRAGKTKVGAALSMLSAMGSDHPDSRAFLGKLGLTPDTARRIQRRMGKVCCVGLTNGESTRVQRPAIAELAPPGTVWRNQHGTGEAFAVLPGGTPNGNGSIVFKTVDQGARAFQADSFDMMWFDEDPFDEAVWNEAAMRLIDRLGWRLVTMSPLRPHSFMCKKFIKQTNLTAILRYLWGEHNPWVDEQALLELLASYSPHERAARARGELTAVEGRVYEFSRTIHVRTPPENIEGWRPFGVIDFGTRNPFCYLLGLLDPKDDTLWIVAEHYQREMLISQHAQHIRRIEREWIPRTWPPEQRLRYADELARFEAGEGPEPEHPAPEVRWADPEDRQSRLALGREQGISTTEAQKAIRPGLNAVAERLAPDRRGEPHLIISPEAFNTIVEIEGYVWHDIQHKDAPKKQDDHAMDALRYLCFGIKHQASWGGE